MRIAKTLVSTLAIAGLIVAVGCADSAPKDSGVDHKAKPAPAETTTTTTTTTTSAPEGSVPATTTTTTTTSAPGSAPATSAPVKK